MECFKHMYTLANNSMEFYYCGFVGNVLFLKDGNPVVHLNDFTRVPFPGLTDFQIGWGYFLLWQDKKLYIARKTVNNDAENNVELIKVPEELSESCKLAATGKDHVLVLSEKGNIWMYKFYECNWRKVPNFISCSDESQNEYPVKLLQAGGTIVLTNLGRIFNVPLLVEMPKRTKFTDIACGFDHTILLTDTGDIYSMGMGTRGQLGHEDLEDCDSPKLIEALAGIKVTQISAGGWHSAVITDQGDLYTWGWNTNGELGLSSTDTKVIAVPTIVDFKERNGDTVEVSVKSVQCGNNFTVCMADDGTFWGCGSNKYGQLGSSPKNFDNSWTFMKLDMSSITNRIKDFKCCEWGMSIAVE